MTITLFGALMAMAIAIILILLKVSPPYSMIFGALIGGIIGGGGLTETISIMINGASGIVTVVIRILVAGVLSGVLSKSGAANTISESIIKAFGEKFSMLAVALSCYILCLAGIFGDVVLLTVAPIGLQTAYRLKMGRRAVLIALVGGVVSGVGCGPIANTIAAAEYFKVPLTSVMVAGFIPSIAGLFTTVILSNSVAYKGEIVTNITNIDEIDNQSKPSLLTSIVGPIVTIALLVLRPILGISIDPIIAMPIGGIVGAIAMKQNKHIREYMEYGLGKMTGVCALLLGTGCLSGIIQNSEIKDLVIKLIEIMGLPSFTLAPISGMLLGAATASSSAGTIAACQIFGNTLLQHGVGAVAAASMINTSSLMLQGLPHGSFFHVGAGAVSMQIKDRLKVIPYEAIIGLAMIIVSSIVLGVFKLF
ncbi:hypothetical protein [Brachyspira intermedia]|uniref:GntP family permease n=1 Tax=Brachyspira intermedia TaxID=84377 RepID=UPI003006186D